jgi:hypothetical protein
MTNQGWSGKRDMGDRMVGVIVGLGLAFVLLAIAGILVIKLLRPEAFERNRGNSIPPTLITAAALEPFTASFTDVASEAGVTAVQASGATGQRLLPETMGSGVVLGDLDGDDDVDLLLLSYGSTPVLYRNDSPSGGPIRFTDVTQGSGLGEFRSTTTAAVGDVDDDGTLDLLVGRIGSDVLMRNLGGMRFEKMTELGDGWTSASGFIDIDHDHDLDLVVGSYVKWSPEIDLEVNYTLDGIGRAYGPPTGFEGTDIAIYVNDGNGVFTDESNARGLLLRRRDRDAPVMKTLGLCFEDADHDGDWDIFVANDTTQNRLFINDGKGVFTEHGVEQGIAFDIDGNVTGAMGVDVVRDENDVLCAIGNFANEPSSLYGKYRYGGTDSFTDRSAVSGVGPATRNSLTFGTIFLDFDLDGEVDLLQVNGHIEPEIARVQEGQSYAQRAQLFRGTCRGTRRPRSGWGLRSRRVAHRRCPAHPAQRSRSQGHSYRHHSSENQEWCPFRYRCVGQSLDRERLDLCNCLSNPFLHVPVRHHGSPGVGCQRCHQSGRGEFHERFHYHHQGTSFRQPGHRRTMT